MVQPLFYHDGTMVNRGSTMVQSWFIIGCAVQIHHSSTLHGSVMVRLQRLYRVTNANIVQPWDNHALFQMVQPSLIYHSTALHHGKRTVVREPWFNHSTTTAHLPWYNLGCMESIIMELLYW